MAEMGATAAFLALERRAHLERGRRALTRLARHPRLLVGTAVVGVLGTFAAMLIVGDAGRIGAIAFVPWVTLLAVELGPIGGGLAGVVTTTLYLVAAATVGGPDDPVALSLRIAGLIGVGVTAGLSSRRISSDALELQATSALQEALLDSTLDGICLTDPDGRLLFGNVPLQRFAVEHGLPPYGTVTDRLFALADTTTEPGRFRERMRELANDPAESEDDFELAETGRVFRGRTTPVRRPNGALVGRIWTLREVTADHHLERLRDTFLAAVSHELRTPLTSISGFLEMLADEEHELGPAGRRYVEVIRRGNARLRRIVDDLLLVAEIEAERLELRQEPADLADLAAAAVDAARPAATAAEIDLQLDSEGPAPLVADAKRLGQVLDHLISNAMKFTPAGGSVMVSATAAAGTAHLEVADTGIGIPHEEVGQVFSRFYRATTATRRAIPGTGLGLVIARAIVEAHGGTIALRSIEGEGSRVIVTLPAGQPAGGT
jgi:signal transduction histidine kinase